MTSFMCVKPKESVLQWAVGSAGERKNWAGLLYMSAEDGRVFLKKCRAGFGGFKEMLYLCRRYIENVYVLMQ